MLLHSIVLSMLVAASGWVVPSPAAACAAAHGAAAYRLAGGVNRFASVCMAEEEAVAAEAPADEVSDFTEDLLDALTTDEVNFVAEPAQFYKPEGGQELEPLPSYTNAQSVDTMRAKYMLHENDSGSTQVQIAVLTARIAYMTKHMESNRKVRAGPSYGTGGALGHLVHYREGCFDGGRPRVLPCRSVSATRDAGQARCS